jgi:predicted transcriptional regulator
MTELEMEIGRNIGSSAFYIYQTLKHNNGMTKKELECETGLSTECIRNTVNKLVDSLIITPKAKVPGIRPTVYIANVEKETWKIH